MEVAGSIGISQAQVSRLEKNALSAIRRAMADGNESWQQAVPDYTPF